jgi:ArsR family transcriptional regulator
MNPYREQAHLLKLMAHPMRLQILDLLRRESECVCHLSAVLGKPQPYVSQQLAVLRHAGLISDDKEGNNVFYRVTDERISRQLDAAFGPARAAADIDLAVKAAAPGCNCPKCQPTL